MLEGCIKRNVPQQTLQSLTFVESKGCGKNLSLIAGNSKPNIFQVSCGKDYHYYFAFQKL
jgi:hypothetical protein